MVQKNVVIIGGGFAGMMAALKLLKNNFTVTLFNPKDNFEFCPLLPDALIKNKPSLAEFSFAPLLAYKNFQFLKEKILNIDIAAKTVRGDKTTTAYDYLFIATGMDARTNIDGGDKNSVLFKTVYDIQRINAILQDKIQSSNNVIVNVVGAGATGVETAIALSAWLKARVKNWQVNLFHNRDVPINNNPPWLAQALIKQLKKDGINFMPNETITRLCPEGVECGATVHQGQLNILTAGGRPNTDFAPAKILNERGQISVNEFLQSKEKNIFAAGDVCSSPNLKTAQAAEYEGKLAADNIIALNNGQPMKQNNFKPRGFLMMTGINKAAGTAFGLRLNGRIAGLLRHGAYVTSLPGIKNRLKLLRAFW